MKNMKINILLFEGFETLDVFGPVEVFSKAEEIEMCYCSFEGDLVRSAQGFWVMTDTITETSSSDVLFVPGGMGTRILVEDSVFITKLRALVDRSMLCLSVCTGSALLAKSGVITGKKATTNKRAYSWATSQNNEVLWQKKARWVIDGKFYTSSGVSAGTDMALAFVADKFGVEKAREIADRIEYIWNSNSQNDPFAVQ
jgi:putative intracellular protease/amidase